MWGQAAGYYPAGLLKSRALTWENRKEGQMSNLAEEMERKRSRTKMRWSGTARPLDVVAGVDCGTV